MHNQDVLVNRDAFSSGQISSKIWLCEELERMAFTSPQKIWVFGGWYGIASFLLLSRGNLSIDSIRSFDIDSTCESIADMVCENWVWKNWTFKAFTADCNNMQYENERPDIVINCSTEHFTSDSWWKLIPADTIVVLQSNNMPLDDHVSCCDTLDDMVEKFPVREIFYKGALEFKYPDWGFTRFMIIGRK
jgi:hypothetical protein